MLLISPNFDVKLIIFPNFGQGLFLKLLEKTLFVLANCSDPDEMSHSGVFHLGLHCFPKYQLRGFQKIEIP